MTYQKQIHNAETGAIEMVDLSPEEVAELEARQQAAAVAEAAAIAEEAKVSEQAAADDLVIADHPTDVEVSSIKTLDDLKALVLRQNAVIDVLIKQAGLKG